MKGLSSFVLCAVLMFSLPAVLGAQELFLGPDSFVPLHGGTLYDLDPVEGGLSMDALSSYKIFVAPIQLPDGAKITAYTVFFKDNSTTSLWFHLFRFKQYATGGWNTIFPYWYTEGASPDKQWIKKTDVYYAYNTIVNAAATYHFYVKFHAVDQGLDLVFYGVKIFYKMP